MTPARWVWNVWAAAGFAALLAGCTGAGGGGATRVGSVSPSGGVMGMNPTTRAYAHQDRNSVDFFLTDLPDSVWLGGADVTGLNGVIVHVHMFITPRAGRTPISTSASTCSVRVLVLSNGEMGLYGGGGFLTRSGTPGEPALSARVARATVRLTRATSGFEDALGASVFEGGFSCTRDDRGSMLLARAMDALVTSTQPVQPPTVLVAE
jgi:hypothetical protein